MSQIIIRLAQTFLFIFLVNTVYSQVITYPLEENSSIQSFRLKNPNYKFNHVEKAKFGFRDTLTLPFFDDFSESTLYPDSTRWLNNKVFINNQFPILPPTLNVATFDGLDSDGRPYDGTINKDYKSTGDSLTSQPINLEDSLGTKFDIGDSIMLSFFYQPNGNGYHLKNEDSLRLFFKAKNGLWIQVWSKAGSDSSTEFKHVIIPILDTNFLHKGFQFAFTTFTGRVGNANHWHIDYVYLDSKREINVDYYDDYAVQTTPSSLLKKYASMPYLHYIENPTSNSADSIYFRASNLFNTGKNIEVKHEVYHKSALLANSNYPSNGNNILAKNSAERTLTIYDFSNISSEDPVVINRQISIREKGIINDYINNDQINVNQVFYDYYAFDDGSAERGFGFDQNTNPSNIEGQIAYGFDITKRDTLYAIATYFNEAVYDVSFNTFRYRIWKDLSGVNGAQFDEMIYESELESPDYNIANGERTFSSHYLDSTIVLDPGKYYIGWWQQSMYNLNVGWDMNYGNIKTSSRVHPDLYYNTFGEWRNTDLPEGTLMMRPHFGSRREIYANINEKKVDRFTPKIYPNPACGKVYLGKIWNQVSIRYSNGQAVKEVKNTDSVDLHDIDSGLYFVTVVDEKGVYFTTKLVIIAQ